MDPGDWTGWGGDSNNSHFQTKPGLTATDVPKLKLKWAFGFPKDPVASSQPAVVGGRLFVGSAAGAVYSFDAATGCIYWTYSTGGAGVRTAISIGKLPNGKWAAYFGDLRATAHAVDAETGAPLWKIKLDEHPAARITGAPALVNGRLYVPMSSLEEVSARQKYVRVLHLPRKRCFPRRGHWQEDLAKLQRQRSRQTVQDQQGGDATEGPGRRCRLEFADRRSQT